MFGIHDFWLFVASGWLLNVTPGPDTAYIVGRSLQAGWRGGVLAALGISAGCMVHVVGAALGLSALLAASATAFAVVKWLGAAYLVYIGVTMLLTRERLQPAQQIAAPQTEQPLGAVFWRGALTNLLNPKVALFFLAFLPQFVVAEAPHKAPAFLLLGAVFILTGTIWGVGVAVVAARASRRIRASGAAMRWINRLLGGVFVYLGARIAMLQAR